MHECKSCKARICLGIYCEVCERQVGIITDRDRLAAENADLRRELDELSREIVAAHFANATLEKLRDVVPEDINNRGYSTHDVLRIWHILYPLETDHE